MGTFWTNNALTGDNMRERPYTTNHSSAHDEIEHVHDSLPRAGVETTNRTSPNTWDETQGVVLAESRGSTTIGAVSRSDRHDDSRYASSPTATGTQHLFIIGACGESIFLRRSVIPSRQSGRERQGGRRR